VNDASPPGSVRIAYLLLAHEAAAVVVARVDEILTYDPDGTVVVHYDAAAPAPAFEKLRRALATGPQVDVLAERVASGWGQFGLAEAALNGLRRLRAADAAVDFVHLISTSCAPTRSIRAFKRHLAAHRGADFIESEGPDWIIGGLREERWTLHHPFNERKYNWWFNRSVQLQRLLGVQRRPPDRLVPRLGSQWWTLSWRTCATLLDYLDAHPEVVRFFRTVWIPDECFFQSLVPHVRPAAERPGHNLTFYQFTNQGKPVVFHDDHADLLKSLPSFFARKISPDAMALRRTLVAGAGEDGPVPEKVGRRTAAYAVKMRAQSAQPAPGQAFYGSQIADAHASLLAASNASYVAVWSVPWLLDQFARRLPADALVQRIPAADGDPPAARLLGALAPAQLIAHHARCSRGAGLVLLTSEVPTACLDAVAADPRGRLVAGLPALADADCFELFLRLAVIASDPVLRDGLHHDAALHRLPLAAVVHTLTEREMSAETVNRARWLADPAAALSLPPAVADALEALGGDEVLGALVGVLPARLAAAAADALGLRAAPAVAKLVG
jgi:hypothetical protein